MKICYISYASLHVKRIIKNMINRGNKVILITYGFVRDGFKDDINECVIYTLDSAPIINIHYFLRMFLKYVIKVRAIINFEKPDLTNVFYIDFKGILGILSGSKKIILYPLGADVFQLGKINKGVYFIQFILFQVCNHIIVTSKHMYEYIQRIYKVPAKKVSRNSFGIDLNIFRERSSDKKMKVIMNQYQLEDNDIIIFSGRAMSPSYNIHLLIQSIPSIIKCFPNTKFLISTFNKDERYYQSLIEYVNNKGLSKNVHFIPRLSSLELSYYYTLSKYFVSIPVSDQFGSSVKEAMHCGSIPILSNIPCYHQYIRDKINGYYLKNFRSNCLSSLIINILEDEQNLKHMSSINKMIIRKFENEQEKIIEMEQIYKKILNHVI